MDIVIGEPCRCYNGAGFYGRQFIGIYYYIGKGCCISKFSKIGGEYPYTIKPNFIIPQKYYNKNFGGWTTKHLYSRPVIDDEYFGKEYRDFDFEMFKAENIKDVQTKVTHVREFVEKVFKSEREYYDRVETEICQ